MKVDIAVIGGGLAGCAAAWYLAREGADVCVIESADLNTRSSGTNAGSIHAQIPHETFVTEGEEWARSFAPTLRLLVDSIELWSGLSTELGADLEFVQNGGLLVADNARQIAEMEQKAAVERTLDVPIETFGRRKLREFAPYVSDTMLGANFCPIEGKANPLIATFTLAHAARNLGARFLIQTRVHDISAFDGGFHIATNSGRFTARQVINAAGIDATRIAALVGVQLFVEGHPLQVTVTAPMKPLVRHLVYFAGAKLTLKQTNAGALLIGGGWPSRHDPQTNTLSVDPESVARNIEVASRVVPLAAAAELVRAWPAMVNGTADWRPVLGEAPDVPGFHVLAFPWMGFTGGPLAAKIVADLVSGRGTDYDLDAFSVAHHQRVHANPSEG